jgi:hypothetical protein
MLVVKLLGQFSVQLNDQPIEIPSRPAQTLFAFLSLSSPAQPFAAKNWPG